MTAVGPIGYYVHHVGRGHLHRAHALARHLVTAGGPPVTGLSSLPRPGGWPGDWVQLPSDEGGGHDGEDAGGRLHWAPLGHAGLRERMAAVSSWVQRCAPAAVVVDVSVEVLLLVRLHGVPVVGVVLPGHRGDAAHLLGLDVADELVGFWPAQAHGMLRGVDPATLARVRTVGALSRYPVAEPAPRVPGPRRAVVMLGRGGHDLSPAETDRLRAGTARWSWTVLDGTDWVEDPSAVVRGADVVVTHAGQNALAEVAAARRPAVVVPQERPHQEQRTTGTVLREGGWPVVVRDTWPRGAEWDDVADAAAGLDGASWDGWCDGGAADRFAEVVLRTARGGR